MANRYIMLENKLKKYIAEVQNELDEMSNTFFDSEEQLRIKTIKLQQFMLYNDCGYKIKKLEVEE